MARRKKHHHEEHENHERWLVSYADLVTLLFAFFVVMYAVSRVDNQRLIQVSRSIRFAMHFEGTGGVGDLPIFEGPAGGAPAAVGDGGGPGRVEIAKARAEKLRKRLEKQLRPMLLAKTGDVAVQVEAEGRRLTVRLSASRFFGSGEAVLHPEAMPVLDAIAAELGPTGLPLRIEGHTDDRPAGGRYRNNWDLSAMRAAAVVSYLEAAHRIPGARLTAAGLASSRPIAGNDDEAGRTANRRVDVVVELEPGSRLDALAP